MGKRVLVVDDDADMVVTTTSLLRLAGHEAKGLTDTIDLLGVIHEFNPDVVILDLAMPGKDGLTAAKEILASNLSKHPVLIACSGERVLKERIYASGFTFYAAKPCDPNYLLRLVDQT
jgi:CheY-like chemotaxis protein